MEFASLVLLLVFSGIIFLVGVYIQIRSVMRKIACRTQAVGTVVGIEEKISYNSDGERNGSTIERTYYHPVYQYEAEGRKITVTSSSGAGRAKFETGQTVTVFYDAHNPEKYHIAEDKAASKFGIILAAFAMAAAAIGVAAYIFG